MTARFSCRERGGRRMLAILGVISLSVPLFATAGAGAAGSVSTRQGGRGQYSRIDRTLLAGSNADAAKLAVLITFKSAPTSIDRKALLAAGFSPGMIRYKIVPAVYAEGSADAVRAISRNARVAYIEPDRSFAFLLDRATAVGRATEAWNASYELAAAVHDDGITGRGVGIAVVDSGVDATHPDLLWKPAADAAGLPAKTVANFKLLGRDSLGLVTGASADLANLGIDGIEGFVEANTLAVDMPDTDTTGGHGTHVAGITSGLGSASNAKYRGAAPGANLFGFGAGETLVIHLGLAAFDWIHQNHAANNIRIVNNSWGGAGDWDPDSVVTKGIRRLVNDDGLVVVFAAGNSGGDGSTIQSSVWGNIPEVIQVANYYDRAGWLDSTSSRGDRSMEHTWPHLAAPGTQIISTAANGKPVTYLTTQDFLIDEVTEDAEPTVVPAPIPVTVETNVAGEDVIVGNYSSLSGTSMASPFVAGVAALVLEANPALNPFQVRDILRETADLPAGHTYEADGFAIGKGVIDAAEAVAVALRMSDGASFDDALTTAYVKRSDPVEINLVLPARLNIKKPVNGATVSGRVAVKGEFHDGPTTDQSIPLLPPPPSTITGGPHIYHAGVIDPFIFGGHTVAPGEPVDLAVRALTSSYANVEVSLSATAEHKVLKDGALSFGPFVAAVSEDGDAFQSSNSWTVPLDATAGNYLFVASVTIGGQTYTTAVLDFAIGISDPSVPASSVARPRLPDHPGLKILANDLIFAGGFEDGAAGWSIRQEGFGPGLLTEWSLIDENSILGWAGPHSGSKYFYAGNWPGTPQISGAYYEDFADTSLISPPMTIGGAGEVSYWRAGQSELDFDFLTAYAAEDGSEVWTELDHKSGTLLDGYNGSWEQSTASLASFAGKTIRLRFQFTSDPLTAGFNLAGWSVDDITVTSSGGGGGETVIVPALTASPTFAVASLTTAFNFAAEANAPITGYDLDFGDGSAVYNSAQAGEISHVYAAPGQYSAVLTAHAGAVSAIATVAIDVAPVGHVQIRIANMPWVDTGPITPSGVFSRHVNASGLLGSNTIEARTCDSTGHCMVARRLVTVT